jgi:hypothetical protein
LAGSISNIDEEVAKCSDGESPVNRKHNVIAGVVGAASSVTSIQVANLLRLFKIPQVSIDLDYPHVDILYITYINFMHVKRNYILYI